MERCLIFICFLFSFSIFPLGAQEKKPLDLNALMPAQVDKTNIFIDPDYYNWCSSVIEGEDGKYHMFYARWPHGRRAETDDTMNYIFDGFQGWLKYSEIAYAVSDKVGGPYRYVKTISKGDWDPNRWDRYTMHNPQIRKFGKYYYLYYISNSYDANFEVPNAKFGKDWAHWLRYNCTQKIGVLKAKSIADLVAGRYERSSQPLMEADHKRTFEVTTNPSVTQGPDGKYYMIFKSRKPNVGNMTMWMAVSDQPDKPFKIISEVFTEADLACEDPFLWYDKRRKCFYAAVKYYAHSKVLAPQFGALALITSHDGVHWRAAQHSVISLRNINWKGKGEVELAHLERPFIVFDKKGNPQALLAAASIGEPTKGNVDDVSVAFNSFIISFDLSKK